MLSDRLHRRDLLKALAAIGGLAVSGCDRVTSEPRVRSVLDAATSLTYRVQRLLIGADRLAREYSEADISPAFRPNGSIDPQDQEYLKLVGNHFADWRLKVHGLVERELSLSLDDLRALPARTQTRGTIASKAGAASANGLACRSRSFCRAQASGQRPAWSCSIAPTLWTMAAIPAIQRPSATMRAST